MKNSKNFACWLPASKKQLAATYRDIASRVDALDSRTKYIGLGLAATASAMLLSEVARRFCNRNSLEDSDDGWVEPFDEFDDEEFFSKNSSDERGEA